MHVLASSVTANLGKRGGEVNSIMLIRLMVVWTKFWTECSQRWQMYTRTWDGLLICWLIFLDKEKLSTFSSVKNTVGQRMSLHVQTRMERQWIPHVTLQISAVYNTKTIMLVSLTSTAPFSPWNFKVFFPLVNCFILSGRLHH